MLSNVVKKETLRIVQNEVLSEIKNALIPSFGPMGSSTTIAVDNKLTQYTKDGHTILKHLNYKDPIENTMRDDLEELTRYIVKTVGDGTTSAIILSQLIFKEFSLLESKDTPYEIVENFKQCVNNIKKEILSYKQNTTLEDIRDIAYTSTNGNVEVADHIMDIYKEFGMDVYIDVSISNTTENILKSYDGMTLPSGYSDTAYINNNKKGICSIRNPRIYTFADPIDTMEMVSFLETIIIKNIYEPANEDKPMVPTVVLCPKISRDLSSYMDNIITIMNQYENRVMDKPPFLLISDISNENLCYDITRMCGCKEIKKYIDPRLQDSDIEKGLAPTLETITDFYGSCDLIEADLVKTKFVNPKNMLDENGDTSIVFNQLVSFLESELNKAYEENQDNNVTGNLKRRINSLKANMVDYLVGGITAADRDSLRDLVEDAVLCCRSAAINGFGHGANFEGLKASKKCKLDNEFENLNDIYEIIYEAYKNLSIELYKTKFSEDKAFDILKEIEERGYPYDLRSENGNKVVCSIQTDIVILDVISKIVSLMFTTNQFLCQGYSNNIYIKYDK